MVDGEVDNETQVPGTIGYGDNEKTIEKTIVFLIVFTLKRQSAHLDCNG